MRWIGLLGASAALVSLVVGLVAPSDSEAPAVELGEVTRGELIVRTVHQGRLDSRDVVVVASRLQGPATIVQMAEEGTRVEPGDLVARFDTAESERDLLRYRTEVALSSAELEKIRSGRQPMEILDLDHEIVQLRRSLAAERQYLDDSLELARDDLLSPVEVAAQEAKVDALGERLAALESKLELTRSYLHPTEVRRAEATLEAAGEELARAKRQIDHGTIVAPSAGVVVYQPLHVAGELRTVRVGDSVYANQPFMLILDFSDLVVEIAVPEAELASVAAGDPVLVQPTSYPELRLDGEVEQLGGIAQSLPGHPSWQRYFRATVGVRDSHPLLRPGMSVVVQVIAYHASEALRIPRRAVDFEGGTATAVVVDGRRRTIRELTLGQAAEGHYEVLAGVEEGARVLLR